jgi:hypothetical protein
MASAGDAVALKEKGNAAFKAHDWPAAIDFYTQAIQANEKEPSFYTNRAQVSSNVRVMALTRHKLTGDRRISNSKHMAWRS